MITVTVNDVTWDEKDNRVEKPCKDCARPTRGRIEKTAVCMDEQLLSRLAFVLDTKLYAVLRAASAAEALATLAGEPTGSLEVMLVELPLPDSEALMQSAQSLHPVLRTVVRSNEFRPPDQLQLAHAWVPHAAGMAELVERIRVLAARKRGPQRALPPAKDEWRGVA